MEFHQLLAQAARRLNLSAAQIGPDIGAMQITLGSRIVTVEPQERRGVLSVSALLCFFPEPDKMAALCELLLEAHAFGLLTDDACFALNRDTSQIILFRNLPMADLDGDRLVDALERFVAVLELWKEAYDSGRLFQGLSETAALIAPQQHAPAHFA